MERVTAAATVRVFQQWAERKMLAGQNGLADAIDVIAREQMLDLKDLTEFLLKLELGPPR